MGQRMEAKETEWVGTTNQRYEVHVIQLLAANQQFATRSCARCAGLLVNDGYDDSNNSGEHIPTALRCVQCGYRIDPVILRNQIYCRSKQAFPASPQTPETLFNSIVGELFRKQQDLA
jgi:hypothetical protein